MMQMPSQAVLQNALHQFFELQDDHGVVAEVQLLSVDQPALVTAEYTCYSAVFALPPGKAASQGIYRVSRGGAAWSLFMAPIRPDASGRACLEAVFHRHVGGAEGGG